MYIIFMYGWKLTKRDENLVVQIWTPTGLYIYVMCSGKIFGLEIGNIDINLYSIYSTRMENRGKQIKWPFGEGT